MKGYSTGCIGVTKYLTVGARSPTDHAPAATGHGGDQRGLAFYVPKGFFPEQDTGRIAGTIQAEQDISFQAMRAKLRR